MPRSASGSRIRRVLALLAALLALAILSAGCSQKSSLGPTNQQTPQPEPAPSTQPTGDTQAGGERPSGSMVVAYQDDFATLDPAIGYDWSNWPAIKMVFDGLMDYDATTNLQPRLAAEMPAVNADATVYTFKLRQDVKFHNGRQLTADDVIYTLTRVLDPRTTSPGAGFYLGIQGAQDFIDGKAASVSGIAALDTYTVQFTLSAPDVTFLNKLALNFAYIVPKEEVEKQGEQFGHHPVGTGPFVFQDWVSGQRIVFARNPEYFYAGLPRLDKVTIEVGVAPEVAILRLEKGEIDLMGDPIPSAEYARIKDDPAWQKRLVTSPQVSTIYIAINTRMEPFDDVRVRQALNHAIDKQRIVKLLNGRGIVANQILPPLMPGYDSGYTGYDYNPEQAKALLTEAGYPKGFETSIECISTDPQPKLCESFQQDLAKVGIKLNIQALAAPTVIEHGGTEGQTPLVWSGGLAWIQDYPDPDDFYAPILGCGSAVQGGWNWAWYCDQQLEARAAQLLGMQDRETRLAGYRELFRALMDEAVWVPVYNGQYDIAKSEPLKGNPGDFGHPEHTLRYEEFWKE